MLETKAVVLPLANTNYKGLDITHIIQKQFWMIFFETHSAVNEHITFNFQPKATKFEKSYPLGCNVYDHSLI